MKSLKKEEEKEINTSKIYRPVGNLAERARQLARSCYTVTGFSKI